MRVAAIDIGTNTVLLLVAERDADGRLRAIAERATITRLGEGVDRTGRLLPAAIERTVECLRDYARIVADLQVDRVSAVATSAMRDAGGAQEARDQVRSALGVDMRVLSGEEEAYTTFRGALGGLSLAPHEDVAVFDIGGGSTEVVLGLMDGSFPRLSFSASYDVGSVRLTERHAAHDPPTAAERCAMMDSARQVFGRVPPMPASTPIGIAGTMTTLAAVSLGRATYDGAQVHGRVLQFVELKRVVDYLASLNLEARKQVAGMEAKRADVILAGGMVALALLEHWAATAVRISDRGVRWGLAEGMLA